MEGGVVSLASSPSRVRFADVVPSAEPKGEDDTPTRPPRPHWLTAPWLFGTTKKIFYLFC